MIEEHVSLSASIRLAKRFPWMSSCRSGDPASKLYSLRLLLATQRPYAIEWKDYHPVAFTTQNPGSKKQANMKTLRPLSSLSSV